MVMINNEIISSNANNAWKIIFTALADKKKNYENIYESSPRGLKVREFIGFDIIIKNPNDCIVYAKERGLSARYLAAEWLWYLSGNTSCNSISKYSGFWENIKNDDGTVNSNYGSYMFVNGEWEKVRNLLEKDPDTRQAVLQIPITRNIGCKDTPCTSSIQFLLRNGKLNMIVYMRSNDIWLGLPYDVHCFSMMLIKMASELGVEVGYYKHSTGSIHLYEESFYGLKEGTFDRLLKEISLDDLELHDTTDKSSDEYLRDLISCRDRRYNDVENEFLKKLLKNKNLI